MANSKKQTSGKTLPKTRYTDEELNEFKLIIKKKLEIARNDLSSLNESLKNQDNDIQDTSPTFKVLEEGATILSKEEVGLLASRQKKFINDLENALIRIENKTYGVCRVTGELIEKDRLKIVPHATLSMAAKLLQNK